MIEYLWQFLVHTKYLDEILLLPGRTSLGIRCLPGRTRSPCGTGRAEWKRALQTGIHMILWSYEPIKAEEESGSYYHCQGTGWYEGLFCTDFDKFGINTKHGRRRLLDKELKLGWISIILTWHDMSYTSQKAFVSIKAISGQKTSAQPSKCHRPF